MNNLSTVSDTKRNFYSQHTRPIDSIYRRVVEELMVEMHLLSTNIDFAYNPIYALGVVSSFDRFMASYRPEGDKQSIFVALTQSMGGNAQKYRDDAAAIQEFARSMQEQDIVQWLSEPTSDGMGAQIADTLKTIASNLNLNTVAYLGSGYLPFSNKLPQIYSKMRKNGKLRFYKSLQQCTCLAIRCKRISIPIVAIWTNSFKWKQ